MKNTIAIASAFIAASSFSTAEIVINEFLTVEGFVDMSYSTTDIETDLGGANTNSFGIDQVEISWLFDFDPVTARIDLEYEEAGDGVNVEQAFVTYHFDNGGAITAGRYASMLGFEAVEPTGLHQNSLAYSSSGFGDLSIIPGYAQGVKFEYETDTTFFGISLQDEVYDNAAGQLGGNGLDGVIESTFGVEIAGSVTMENGLTFFLGGAYEDGEIGDTYVINTYVTFETGAWIFATEVNFGNRDREDLDFILPGADIDALSALVMANFAYSDQASVTGRISYAEFDDGIIDVDILKYTAAHNYAFTDNLLLVLELSYVDADLGGFSYEELGAAAEILFTF